MRNKPSVRAFISYSSHDGALAEILKTCIEGDGLSCFYAPLDIRPREVWRDRLEDEIKTADLILLLYTDAAGSSDEVYKEITLGSSTGKPIWLTRQAQTRVCERLHPFNLESRYNSFIFSLGNETDTFTRLREAIDQAWGRTEPPVRGGLDRNQRPYPGSPYTEQESNLFFGRDAECNQLLSALQDRRERLFFVYGPSGAGKTSLLNAGLRKILDRAWWFPKEPISASAEEGNAMGNRLWRRLEKQLEESNPQAASGSSAEYKDRMNSETDPSERQLVSEIAARVNQLANPRHILWFDHMEHLLALEEGEQIDYFFKLTNEILERCPTVRILVSFREELLSTLETRAERWIDKGVWKKWLVRRLSLEGARDCIVRPARLLGVEIDGILVDALIKELAGVEGVDRNGEQIVTVNPVQLQLVCGLLWLQAKEGFSRITAADLPETGRGLAGDVAAFVSNALQNHLEDVIQKLAAATPHQEQTSELIKLGLLQFVSEGRKRQQIRESISGGVRRVGRMHFDIVKALEDERLIQRSDVGLTGPDVRYELVHDSLVETIDRYRGKVPLLRTLNTLESTLKSKNNEGSGLKGFFNSESTLLADLEDSRGEKTGFFEEEKEFLFRCALGDLRLSVHDRTISLAGWAGLLAESSPRRFARVLEEALSQSDDSVSRDAVNLFAIPSLRASLTDKEVESVSGRIFELALKSSQSLRERACLCLAQVSGRAALDRLFALLGDENQRPQARGAIERILHAIETGQIDGQAERQAFEGNWKSTSWIVRQRMLMELWTMRGLQSFGWIAFVVAMATIFTALGAGIAYTPMGAIGAALTLGDRAAGGAKGAFHGICGGVGWGIGIATALLLYWVIFKGGRFAKTRSGSLGAIVSAGLGGFAGGIVLSFVLGFVFQNKSLYNAGWLLSEVPADIATKLGDMFLRSRHGWIMPVLGLAVGVGIAWSLGRIFADPETEAYVEKQREAIQSPMQVSRSIWIIAKRVVRKSWCTAIAVSLGGLLVFAILNPGPGICDSNAPKYVETTPTRAGVCAMSVTLAPLPIRVSGMAFIIWFGSIFLQVGFLFGILAARVGVKLERDENFLRTVAC